MPVRVDSGLCDGCEDFPEKRCEAICPGDLMTVDPQTLKAFCRDCTDCWDCFACVKACPTGAVTPRLAYTIALYGVRARFERAGGAGRWIFSDTGGGGEAIEVPGDGP
jgi:adenylylsulfate reductase subunit B